jgi:hypothetical protein
VATHCGLRVAAVSCIIDLAEGMSEEVRSHEGTLAAPRSAPRTAHASSPAFLQELPRDPYAPRIIGLIDLTSLNDDDTDATVDALWRQGRHGRGPVRRGLHHARVRRAGRERLEGTGVRIATVANFPAGEPDPDAAAREVAAAVVEGADEGRRRARGGPSCGRRRWRAGPWLVAACSGRCDHLKVILETGSQPERGRSRGDGRGGRRGRRVVS